MSQPFRRIVVGVDLGASGEVVTPGSRIALDRARWLGERFGSEVALIHSYAPDEYWNAGEGGFVQADARDGAGGHKALDALLEEFRHAGIDVRLERSEEKAWLAILHDALRWDADLIIAGKRTESFEDGRKLGSVAKKLLRKAPCAVWLEDPRRKPVPRVLVAATDLSAVGDRVLSLSAGLAREFDAELHVVHAYTLPLSVQMEGDEAEQEFGRSTRADAERRIRTAIEGTPAAERAQIHVGLTSPTRAILAVVERSEADLVVMGTLSRGGVAGLLVGNSAERLFDTLDCALLTVKPDDFVCPLLRETH